MAVYSSVHHQKAASGSRTWPTEEHVGGDEERVAGRNHSNEATQLCNVARPLTRALAPRLSGSPDTGPRAVAAGKHRGQPPAACAVGLSFGRHGGGVTRRRTRTVRGALACAVAALPVPQPVSTRGGRPPPPCSPPARRPQAGHVHCHALDTIVPRRCLGAHALAAGVQGWCAVRLGGQREHSAAHASRTAPSPRVRRRWWGPRGAATRRRGASPPTCAGRPRGASVIRLNCDYRRTASTGRSGSRGSTAPQCWHASHTGAGQGPAGSLLCLAWRTVSFHDLRKGRDGAMVAWRANDCPSAF